AAHATSMKSEVELRLTDSGGSPKSSTAVTLAVASQTSLGVNCGTSSIVGSANPTTDIDGIVRVVISYDSHPAGCSVSQFFISVNDGSNTVNVTVDAGLASESAKIAGLNNDDLVKVGSSNNITTKTLTQDSFEKLVAFVNGATFGGGLGTYTYTPPAGGGGTVTSITSQSSALTVGGTSAVPTLSLNIGTSANQLVQLDGSGLLPALNGSQLMNVSVAANNVTSASGQYLTYKPGNTTCSNGSGLQWTANGWDCGYQQYDFSSIVASANSVPVSTGSSFSSKTVSTTNLANSIVARDSGGKIEASSLKINNVTLSQPTGTSYTLSLPPAGPTNGQTLVANSSGALQWQSGPLHIERKRATNETPPYSFNFLQAFSLTPVCTCTLESYNSIPCYISSISPTSIEVSWTSGNANVSIICIEP
ncbi:MAG TPA: hypothetical protein PLU50_04870, partial [Pseudobdellovibrionaceae bacterium]|nr:hypothetical protein [Pseudobdellovibrionaceae bacterium]